MSANNWAHCPRCTRVGGELLDEREAKIWASYGKIPAEQFEQERAAVQTERAEFADRDETFRENYKIYGAETGTVTVEYSGSCQACGLSLKLEHAHPIPGLEGES